MEANTEPSSSCSTPYHSAPSSPSPLRALNSGCYFSAPTSPMHYLCAAAASASASSPSSPSHPLPSSFEFEFSARCLSPSAASAEDLFLNGQIRPTLPSSPLPSPPDTRGRDLRLRSRSVHRRARSMSPLRNPSPDWHDEKTPPSPLPEASAAAVEEDDVQTPPVSASSSRSSSTSSSSLGRSSRRWISLRDLLLYRSKSEGRANPKDRFWHLSPSKEKPSPSSSPLPLLFYRRKEKEKEKGKGEDKEKEKEKEGGDGKVGRRRRARSAHERHYEEKRAEAEEMRKRTFLPYRAGLLGCLGFSSRSYGAVTGFARTWNAVGSR